MCDNLPQMEVEGLHSTHCCSGPSHRDLRYFCHSTGEHNSRQAEVHSASARYRESLLRDGPGEWYVCDDGQRICTGLTSALCGVSF